MRLTREQKVGLEPMPNGCIVGLQDPYKKTIKFVRETDTGRRPCEAPPDFPIPPGYRVVK